MLYIHKNVDGTYWIALEIKASGDKPVLRFSGSFQRIGDEEGESDNTLNISVPTVGDVSIQ